MAIAIRGKDDFLFLAGDTNNVIRQISGDNALNEKMIAAWGAEFEERRQHSRTHNYLYKFIIVPNKHCVYADKLPDDVPISENRPAIQLRDKYPDIIEYPIDILKKRRDEVVYHKTDTHWNSPGAVIYYNDLAVRLGLEPLKYEVTDIQYMGDLGNKMQPPLTLPSKDIKFVPKANIVYDNKFTSIGHGVFYENDNKSLPVAIVFGDSFINLTHHILAEYFSRLYFFHAPVFDQKVIERIAPDIVLNENVERFVHALHEKSLPERVYKKIFGIGYNLIGEVANFSGWKENVSGINYEIVNDYISSYGKSKNASDYLINRANVFLNHIPEVNCVYEFVFSREFSGRYWKPDQFNSYNGWACGFSTPNNEIAGMAFFLQNIYANNKILISIYKYNDNGKTFNEKDMNPIISNEYDVNDLFIYSDMQEVFFPLKLPDLSANDFYLVTIRGDAMLGMGKSTKIFPADKYFLLGYYSQFGSDSYAYHVVAGTNSIAWRFVYPRES